MSASGELGIDCSSIRAARAASRMCSTLSYLTDCTAIASAGFMWESTSMLDSGASFGAALSPLTACRAGLYAALSSTCASIACKARLVPEHNRQGWRLFLQPVP